MIPFELFKLLGSVTETFILKKEVIFKSFSVWVFLMVSTGKVLFLSFLTDFGVPIKDSIYFSIIKGDKQVTGFEPS